MMAAKRDQYSDQHWFTSDDEYIYGGRGKRGDILMFGNPLVGNAIAAEHMSALPMTKRLGCGSSMPSPTCCTSGKMIKAATV